MKSDGKLCSEWYPLVHEKVHNQDNLIGLSCMNKKGFDMKSKNCSFFEDSVVKSKVAADRSCYGLF